MTDFQISDDSLIILGAAYAGKEAVGVIAELMKEMLGPSARAIGKGIAAPIEAWAERRVKSASDTVFTAARTIADSGGTARPVPGRILGPLLEKSSLEEEPDLRARWAALLANASMTPDAVLPSFVSILGELSPIEARLLQRIYELSIQYAPIVARTNNPNNTEADHLRSKQIIDALTQESLMESVGVLSASAFIVYATNLERLMLISQGDADSDLPGANWPIVTTSFGDAFMAACMTPIEREGVHGYVHVRP